MHIERGITFLTVLHLASLHTTWEQFENLGVTLKAHQINVFRPQ